MIELILGQFAPYIIGLLGFAALWFGVSSKVNKSKVKRLEKDKDQANLNTAIYKQAHKEVVKEMELKDEATEILTNRDDFDGAVERMRERARSRNGNKE